MEFSKAKKISKYFSEYEVFNSDRANLLGIDNGVTDPTILANIANGSANLDAVREAIGLPIKVNSWFRSKALNNVTPNSSNTSQHMKGEAIDLDLYPSDNLNNKDLAGVISKGNFDQMILYIDKKGGTPRFVHVSYKRDSEKNRNNILVKQKGVSGYEPYLETYHGKLVRIKPQFKEVVLKIALGVGLVGILAYIVAKLKK